MTCCLLKQVLCCLVYKSLWWFVACKIEYLYYLISISTAYNKVFGDAGHYGLLPMEMRMGVHNGGGLPSASKAHPDGMDPL